MTISVNELATKAMSMSGEARALLAEKLVESLDQELAQQLLLKWRKYFQVNEKLLTQCRNIGVGWHIFGYLL